MNKKIILSLIILLFCFTSIAEPQIKLTVEVPDVINLNDEVTIKSEFIDFDEYSIVNYQWQYSEDGEHFYDIIGAIEKDYTFYASIESLSLWYRLNVVCRYKEMSF